MTLKDELSINYCNENNLVYWDLFNASKGLKGAAKWKSSKLLQSDLVHFSREGYTLQGNLFVDAFAKAWNGFLSKNYVTIQLILGNV